MYKHVTSIVISFHLLLMTCLLFSPRHNPVKKTHHVKVRTVHPIATVKQTPKPVPASKPAPKKVVKTPPPVVKKPAPVNKPAVKPIKRALPKKAEAPAKMWSEIDQALAKIEQKSYTPPKQSVTLPNLVSFLDEGTTGEEDEMTHLTQFLHDTLHLPEVGEVKVEMTVRKDGQIVKVVILRSGSQKNTLYLQEHLPLLQLPVQFDQDKKWIMTFCNEI